MSGVTHLPEVQCIDLMSVLGALNSKNSLQTAAVPAVQHIASDPPTNGCHSPSLNNGSPCQISSNGSAPALSETETGESPFPVLCLVLATDGVW